MDRIAEYSPDNKHEFKNSLPQYEHRIRQELLTYYKQEIEKSNDTKAE